jgi:hypothetical protein
MIKSLRDKGKFGASNPLKAGKNSTKSHEFLLVRQCFMEFITSLFPTACE